MLFFVTFACIFTVMLPRCNMAAVHISVHKVWVYQVPLGQISLFWFCLDQSCCKKPYRQKCLWPALSKRWYINNKLEACKNNMKETWRLLNGLLNKKQRKDNYPTPFKCNYSKDSDYYTIANTFGTFFSNLGQNLAKKIPELMLAMRIT